MAANSKRRPKTHPAQLLKDRPGRQHKMKEQPKTVNPEYKAAGKLKGKIAVITGGDSGIGRAVAVAFAREGADIAINFLEEHKDAKKTVELIKKEGRQCFTLAGDLGDEKFCKKFVDFVIKKLGKIDILINNAAEQHPAERLEDITSKQLERTYRSNIFSMFYLTKAVMPHLKSGASIINTSSVTAFRGSSHLLDYSSTKGAIISFTRSLSLAVAEKNIRVNAVAPGPIWTPLIPSTFGKEKVKNFGRDVPLGRAGQPEEVAPAYVFLASQDSSYVTGQTIHVNGGEVVNA